MLNQPGDTSGPNSGAQALAQLLQKDRFVEREVWWGRVGHDGQVWSGSVAVANTLLGEFLSSCGRKIHKTRVS